MTHWLGQAFSTYVLHPMRGNGYQWWSGPGGDLGLLTALIVYYRKHTCHVRHCPRLGKHPVDGTDWVVCKKHHPDDQPKHYLPTPKQIFKHHEIHRRHG